MRRSSSLAMGDRGLYFLPGQAESQESAGAGESQSFGPNGCGKVLSDGPHLQHQKLPEKLSWIIRTGKILYHKSAISLN